MILLLKKFKGTYPSYSLKPCYNKVYDAPNTNKDSGYSSCPECGFNYRNVLTISVFHF